MRHPFDLEFGTRTSGLIAGRHLKSGHRNDRNSTAYFAVAPSVMQGLVVRWRRSRPIAPIDEFTFVDLGAGMGRAMLLASQYPFRSVVGVELNPTLARIARKNAAQWRMAGRALAPMRVVCRDAVEFAFPKGPCVAFLFNPFNAQVMRRLLDTLAKRFAARPEKPAIGTSFSPTCFAIRRSNRPKIGPAWTCSSAMRSPTAFRPKAGWKAPAPNTRSATSVSWPKRSPPGKC